MQYNGVTLEDCATWTSGPLVSDRSETAPAWCFTNASTGARAACNLRGCSRLDTAKCPSTAPNVRRAALRCALLCSVPGWGLAPWTRAYLCGAGRLHEVGWGWNWVLPYLSYLLPAPPFPLFPRPFYSPHVLAVI